MTEIIKLPIPSAKLAANSRCSRFTKAKITKYHRSSAAMFAFQQIDKHPMASYKLVFFWPDKTRRDERNAAERCKAYEDGIADYLGQDDSEWNFTGVEFGDVDKEDPRVEFHFTTIEEATEQVDELTELRKDRARLDWLCSFGNYSLEIEMPPVTISRDTVFRVDKTVKNPVDLRESIDVSMEDVKHEQ